MRNELAQLGVLVQRDQAADPRVFGVVLLLSRAAAAGDQVRVDRQHREPGVDQRLDQQTVAGLQHHPYLGRVRLQRQTPSHQPGHPGRAVVDPELFDHPLPRNTQRHIVKLLGPIHTNSEQHCLLRDRLLRSRSVEARRRADGPVLTGQHPRGRLTSAGHPRGRRLMSVLAGQAREAFLGGHRAQ